MDPTKFRRKSTPTQLYAYMFVMTCLLKDSYLLSHLVVMDGGELTNKTRKTCI